MTDPETFLPTAGERLVGRLLLKEKRAGIEHYVPGQHEAVIYPESTDLFTGEPCQIARVTYVDVMGHVCIVVCVRERGGEWKPTWAGRAGQTWTQEPVQIPDGAFVLSERVLEALAKAELEELPT